MVDQPADPSREPDAGARSPYLDISRPEVLPFVPAVSSLLDVGCSTGAFGKDVKDRFPNCRVWGVEPRPEAAEIAAQRLDGVVRGDYPDVLHTPELMGTTWDCITFLDALEHMVDPWGALRATIPHLAPGGRVLASIPNIQNARVLQQLIRGRFDYADLGILDRTHLRFFTRATIVELFESTGYTIESLRPISFISRGRLAKVLRRAGQRAEGFRTIQYLVTATPRA